jgi:hypothetical protein
MGTRDMNDVLALEEKAIIAVIEELERQAAERPGGDIKAEEHLQRSRGGLWMNSAASTSSSTTRHSSELTRTSPTSDN